MTSDADDVATRIARRALAKRGANYATEVRRLLDAALEVMRTRGTGSRPRVADIVAAAGLSNEAFYRHFSSKDAMVEALLEEGTQRLRTYVEHQMGKESTPEGKVRRWVEAVLSQATGDIAVTTRAVSWNAGTLGADSAQNPRTANAPMAALLVVPFTEIGSAEPEFDASLAAHATLGKLTDYLWQRVEPSQADLDHITRFCLKTVTRES